eukprot:CAMPEP_0184482954 /NCGR_PEP_ID=MMETSP0113_2-20130426/4556_1 /TAXON_ID=91329 /ORGANISM="Norrisiella sphaerica, Strain BC52" /LENGTH=73 /DNA_ID=CAMNT_0026863021 /DNA_START=33 /DNA_END=254 /DNA_ORIENTATION=-
MADNSKEAVDRKSSLEEGTFEILYEMSRVLNCGLDRQTLSILISLCENGVNPEALSSVVKELRRETSALQEVT